VCRLQIESEGSFKSVNCLQIEGESGRQNMGGQSEDGIQIKGGVEHEGGREGGGAK
jgi:hypothetical protein